jgi:F5/8 type C domain
MATVGQQLTAPESGWKRYDNSHATMKYSSGFSVHSSSNLYGGTQFQSNVYNANYSFKFIGTKFRIIDALGPNRDKNVQVTVDGIVTGYYSAYQSSGDTFQVLVYELTGLEYGLHTVEVRKITQDSSYISMDCIDIDDTGRLLHPDEVTDIKDLTVGKRIRYNYTAPSGSFGYFGGIGKETGSFIPSISSATPNGDAYAIMIGVDHKGRKVLFTDRNVQHSISYDVLNNAGVASGSGLPIKYGRLVPIMTSNTTPSGRAYASSYYGSQEPWRAFDGVKNSDAGKWTSATQDGKGWLAYEFPAPVVVTSYRITGHYSATWISQNPTEWTLEGSNDGAAWTVLDSRSGITWSTGAEQKAFDITNRTPYKHYRINITSIGNNSYRAVIGELELFEPLTSDEYAVIVRLPMGGVAVTDKDNEWDEVIVNSTLDGTITAGDNNVWNWSSVQSWTSTTPSGSGSLRITRGGSSVSFFSNRSTSTTVVGVGFRPVFVIEELGASFSGGLSSTLTKLEDITIIGDVINPTGSQIRYRILVNGVERIPYSSFGTPPLSVNRVLLNSWFSFGNNVVVVEMETTGGNLTSATFNVYKDYAKKFLIRDGVEYKSFIGGAWVTVGTSATRDLFVQQGMDELDPDKMLLLSPKVVRVAHWTNEPDSPTLQKSLTIDGEKKIGFRYKVEIQDPPTVLKDWTESLNEVNETLTISASYITSAVPYTVTVTAVNDVTTYTDSKSGTVTLLDAEPTIEANMTGMRLDVTVGDPDSDTVKFRILLNGNQIYPVDQGKEFTDLEPSPVSYTRLLRSNEVVVGGNNTLTIIAQDQFGKQNTRTLSFIGEYAGLMFADEAGEFYSDDLGNVLKYLDVGVLVAGQVSDTYPIRLINRTGYTVTNITLTKDNKTLPSGAMVEISRTAAPFEPVDTLVFNEVLNYGQEVMFYVRVVTQLNNQPKQGEFDVFVKADPA